MANVRAGVAYIDVRLGSVERFKRELKEKVSKIGKESGDDFSDNFAKQTAKNGAKAGAGFVKNFGQSFTGFGALFRTIALPALVGAILQAAPFLGATFGAALVSGGALAVIGAGILAVKDDPKVKSGWKALGDSAKKTFAGAARSFVPELTKSFGIVEASLARLKPQFTALFASVAPFIPVLTTGLTKFVEGVLPGLQAALSKAGPIIQVLSEGLGKIGRALGSVFEKITSDPAAIKGMAQALDDLITGIALSITWFGNFIKWMSIIYAFWRQTWLQAKDIFFSVWNSITGWFNGTILPSLKRAGSQAVAAWDVFRNWLNSLPGWFRDRWNSVVGALRSALSAMNSAVVKTGGSIIGWFKDLPGKVIGAIGGLAGRLYSAGADAVRGFLNGISDMGGAVIDKARDLANSVASTIRGALQIFSPSRVMEKLGIYTGQGFAKGLDASMPNIANHLPKGIPATVGIDFGSPKKPQMDETGSSVTINQEFNNVDISEDKLNKGIIFELMARGFA